MTFKCCISTPQPTLSAQLLTSIVPEIHQGTTIAQARATTATVVDHEGVLRLAQSGEARFMGARRVENLLITTEVSSGWNSNAAGTGSAVTKSDNYGIVAAPDGSFTAMRYICALNGGTSAADRSEVGQGPVGPAAFSGRFSVWLRTTDGSTKTITLRFSSTLESFVINGTWQRYCTNAVAVTAQATAFMGLRGAAPTAVSDSIDFLAWHPQAENVSGQSNQAPGEYTSRGVLAAPYFGANADGVRYLATTNGNSVNAGVVTEAAGAKIADATLRGYLSESAATNLCLQSETIDNASWTKTDTTVTANAIAGVKGSLTADLLTDGSAGTASLAPAAAVTIVANSVYTLSAYIKKGNNQWMRLSFVDNATLTNRISVWVDLTNGVLGTTTVSGAGVAGSPRIEALANGWYRVCLPGTIDASSTAAIFSFLAVSGDTSGTRVNGATYYLDGVQFELTGTGGTASGAGGGTSYIPTTTTSVTRNSDGLTYTRYNIYDPGADYTIYSEARLNFADRVAAQCLFGSALSFNPHFWASSGAALIVQGFCGNGTTSSQIQLVQIATATRIGNICKYAMRRRGGVPKVFVNGIEGSVPNGADPDGTLEFTNVSIGYHSSTNIRHLNGTIRNVNIWKKHLGDPQIMAMTL